MIWNAFLMGLREIRRNALRSALTILGIVIGVAAVIIMVTIGNGATLQVTQQIASLGSNLLMITPGQRVGMGQRSAAPAFRVEDAAAIAREVGNVAAVAPSVSRSVTAVAGNRNWTTRVTGVDGQYLEVANWTVAAGRSFSEPELRAGKAVCIAGDTLVRELFGQQSALGSRIRLKNFACQVVGVLEAKGQSTMGSDQDDLVLIPLRTFHRRIAGNQDVALIQVSLHERDAASRTGQDIVRVLRKRRHISAGEEDDFSVRDLEEIARMLTGTTRVLTALLGAVAAVSLLVGGIGIMNIMLVSVTERTHEIGIRLAIGAREREVLVQFLVEAVVLSSFGGLVGVLLAVTASIGLARVLQVPFVFDPSIVLIAFLFAALVGVLFGFFPARKAARMDPIEALRRE
jgi:putative ABC transport system permease protein